MAALTPNQSREVSEIVSQELGKQLRTLTAFGAIFVFIWSVVMAIGGYAIKASVESATVKEYLDSIRETVEITATANLDAKKAAKEAGDALKRANASAITAEASAQQLKGTTENFVDGIVETDGFKALVKSHIDQRVDRLSIDSGLKGAPLVVKGNLVVDGYLTVRMRTSDGGFRDAVTVDASPEGGEITVFDSARHHKIRLFNSINDDGGKVALYRGESGTSSGNKYREASGAGGFYEGKAPLKP